MKAGAKVVILNSPHITGLCYFSIIDLFIGLFQGCFLTEVFDVDKMPKYIAAFANFAKFLPSSCRNAEHF